MVEIQFQGQFWNQHGTGFPMIPILHIYEVLHFPIKFEGIFKIAKNREIDRVHIFFFVDL